VNVVECADTVCVCGGGRLRCRCKDNIEMDLERKGLQVVDWIDRSQEVKWRAVLNAVVCLEIRYVV
jgi:hypothetical protein